MAKIYAHSGNKADTWQTFEEHASNVASIASFFAAKIPKITNEAILITELLGWLHDLGKGSQLFQAYLRGEVPKGVDHSTLGGSSIFEDAPFISLISSCHHTGFPNASDFGGRMRQYQRDEQILKDMISILPNNIVDSMDKIKDIDRNLKDALGKHKYFFLLRMLHSCLIDADCLDTEEHFDKSVHSVRSKEQVDNEILLGMLNKYHGELVSNSEDTEINRLRREVYDCAIKAAEGDRGYYSLKAPTGLGKTLAYIAFAINHMIRHNMDRVIVVLPFLSITDQVADVLRSIFGSDVVLEHDSSVNFLGEKASDSRNDFYHRLMSQNWASKVIVTTSVQFYESLFSNRNRKMRKLHNMINSVIILDEFQTLPIHLTLPTVNALNILVEDYNCTIVRSTATMNDISEFLKPTIIKEKEIVEEYRKHFRLAKRVNYIFNPDPLTWQDVANRLKGKRQAIVILNTIKDCLSLLTTIGRNDVIHLSTNMCPAHRKIVLQEVRIRLRENEPCLLITTTVVEAGVDLDFPYGMRAIGPADSIAQGAGRVNRNGILNIADFDIFIAAEGSYPPGSYTRGKECARWMLMNGNLDLNNPDVFKTYYNKLFKGQELDEVKDGNDTFKVMQLLEKARFEDVGRLYKIIPDDTIPVVVRKYGDCEVLIKRIINNELPSIADFRALDQYKVNLRRKVFDEYFDRGLISEEKTVYIWEGGYDDKIGLKAMA